MQKAFLFFFWVLSFRVGTFNSIQINYLFTSSLNLYFKVSLLHCNYTFKYWVMLFNYMYLLLA